MLHRTSNITIRVSVSHFSRMDTYTGEAILSNIFFSSLLKRVLQKTPFQKGFGVQKCKQEVTEVVSLTFSRLNLRGTNALSDKARLSNSVCLLPFWKEIYPKSPLQKWQKIYQEYPIPLNINRYHCQNILVFPGNRLTSHANCLLLRQQNFHTEFSWKISLTRPNNL